MRDSTTSRGVNPVETAAPSKTEALRQAITALGYRAPVTEILAYVRDHFGIGEPISQETTAVAPPVAAPVEATPAREDEKRPASKRGKSKDRTNPAE